MTHVRFQGRTLTGRGTFPGYLAILTAHHVPYETVWSESPGRVIYADVHQIVVT